MNNLTIIGNLTKDPELRTTTGGISVCNFTVAVNSRRNEKQETQFFRVSAWRGLGENCAKFLAKGKKVCVVGPVEVRTYESNGETKATMEVTANDVEFLSSKNENNVPEGYTRVEDEIPY